MKKNTVKDGIKDMPLHSGQDRCFQKNQPHGILPFLKNLPGPIEEP